jgi:hypothetical protein
VYAKCCVVLLVEPCTDIDGIDADAYLDDRPIIGYRGVKICFLPNRACNKGDIYVLMHVNPLLFDCYVYILPKFIYIFMGSFACLYDRGG